MVEPPDHSGFEFDQLDHKASHAIPDPQDFGAGPLDPQVEDQLTGLFFISL
jgi:hypothetical protein